MKTKLLNINPNEESSESQCKKIQDYLQEAETLTQLECLGLCDCFRLASRMNDLKKRGLSFDSVFISVPSGKHVKAYYIPELFASRFKIEKEDEEFKNIVKSYAEEKVKHYLHQRSKFRRFFFR